MAYVKCQCGNIVSDEFEYCPHCGKKLINEEYVSCPTCGCLNTKTAKLCASCHRSLIAVNKEVFKDVERENNKNSIPKAVIIAICVICIVGCMACCSIPTGKQCVHDFAISNTVEATCNTDGYNEYTCSKCKEKKEETITKLDHDYQEVISKEATCTEKGSKSKKCTKCGDEITEEIEMLEHDFEVADEKEATCTESGYFKGTCKICGFEKDEEIEALGHDYKENKTVPTCATDGKSKYTCSRCKDEYSEIIKATGHNIKNGKCTKCGSREYKKVDLTTMFNELNSNAMRAEETYNHEYIEFTGYINVIDSDGKYISVAASPDEFLPDDILCDFTNDAQKKIVMNLNKGSKVTIKGHITSIGEILGYCLDIDEIY